MCCRFQSGRPLRMRFAPALATSAQALVPPGAEPSTGGASERPSGNTLFPLTTREPVGPSIVTTAITGEPIARGRPVQQLGWSGAISIVVPAGTVTDRLTGLQPCSEAKNVYWPAVSPPPADWPYRAGSTRPDSRPDQPASKSPAHPP